MTKINFDFGKPSADGIAGLGGDETDSSRRARSHEE
nr:hypothetical protein AUSP0001_00030 [uncultured phage]